MLKQRNPRSGSRFQRGFSLAELMVTITISLLVTGLITRGMMDLDKSRRVVIGRNDGLRSGSFALDVVSGWVRNAGSGMAQVPGAYNCSLRAWVHGSQRFPLTAPLPSPFDVLPLSFKLAPLLVFDGGDQGTDVLVIATGSSAAGSVLLPNTAPTSTIGDWIGTSSTVGLSKGDALLLTRYQLNSAGESTSGECWLTQIASNTHTDANGTPENPFPIAHAKYSPPTSTLPFSSTLSKFTASTLGTDPKIIALGIQKRNGRSDLVMVDLLANDPSKVQVVADNVVDFQVLYGVDTTQMLNANVKVDMNFFGDGSIDSWVAATGDWSAASMMLDTRSGSPAWTGAERQRRVKALRIALVTTDVFVEKNTIQSSSSSIVLFAATDMPALTITRKIGGADGWPGTQRYSKFEALVPLRNLAAPLSPLSLKVINP
jgi:prepilin-type N-terminal cleavage/methylation domain-containing protein